MPDHLPRATCEALAEAYASMRRYDRRSNPEGHVLTEGDLLYGRNTFGMEYTEEPAVAYSFDDHAQCWPAKRSEWWWCPRTDDLLAIGTKTCVCVHLKQHGPEGNWACHDCAHRETVGNGDTPAQALAAWLLVRAGYVQRDGGWVKG